MADLAKVNFQQSDKIKTLKLGREDLISDLTTVKKENVSLHSQIKDLNQKNQDLQSQITNLEEDRKMSSTGNNCKSTDFERRINILTSENSQLLSKNKSLQSVYDKVVQDSETEQMNSDRNITDLNRQIRNLKIDNQSFSTLKIDLKNKETLIEQLKIQLQGNTKDLDQSITSIKIGYEKKLTDLQEEFNQLENQLANESLLKIELSKLQELIKIKDNSIARLESVQAIDNQSSPQKPRIDELYSSLRKQEESMLEYNSSLSALKETESRFNAREIKLKDLIDKKNQAYEGIKIENKMLGVTIKKLESENNKLEKDQIMHDKKVLSLQRQLMDKDKDILEIEKRYKNMSLTSNHNTFSTTGLNEAQVLKFEGKIERLQISEQNLKIQVARLETELNSTKRQYGDLQRQRNSLNLDSTPSKSRNGRPPLGSDYDNSYSTKKGGRTGTKIGSLNEEMATNAFDLDGGRTDRSSMLKDPDFESLYQEVKSLRETVSQKNTVIKQQEKNLKLCNDLAFKVASTLEEMGKKNKQLEDKMEGLKGRDDEISNRLATMTGVIAELRKRNSKLETKNDDLTKQVNNFKGRGPTNIEENHY